MPRSRHASAVSIAYSAKITGSLYVNATLRQPRSCAMRAIPSGEAASISVSISRDLLMSQFWQNLQARLQAAVVEQVPPAAWVGDGSGGWDGPHPPRGGAMIALGRPGGDHLFVR